MRPEQRRRAVEGLKLDRQRPLSRACRLVGLTRSGFRYRSPKALSDEKLRAALREAALRFKRWGLPRLHDTLRKAGLVKNRKRTARIYREEKLQVRKRKRKKISKVPRIARPKASRPNEVWSIDFVFDWAVTKRKIKCLTVVDDFTKECIGILVGHSISGSEAARFLASQPRLPVRIRSDNGPEFQSNAFLAWVEESGIEHEFTTPGKPNENAYIESFNSRFRDECLNEHIFLDLKDAKQKIEVWRQNYNELHPHSSLKMKTPKEFAQDWKEMLPTYAAS